VKRAPRSALALAGALPLLAAGCSMTRIVEVPESLSRYDRLPDDCRADFRAARAHFERGDLAQARAGFERLLERQPEVVPVGVWWQECQILLAPPEVLRARSGERAALAPGVAAEVLAARAQADSAAAEPWFARAEARDPECAWIHYGRAHFALREGRLDEARIALERALAADPGHLPARRLETRILARDGAAEAARNRLAGWIERASAEPLVLPRDLAEARLDAVLLSIALQDPGGAEDALEELDARWIEPWRLAATRACLARERGDLVGARGHADAARAQAPREILPAVQEALLFDDQGGDAFRARAAWIAVRELASQGADLATAFETVRARVRLERLDRAAEAAEAGARPPR
jgi:tetratricopeptide (TPR) repeat protein